MVEVLDFYDGPKLFTVRNRAGTLYLAYWADQDDASDIWYYVPISGSRLEAVRAGECSLRDAIAKPEDGVVLEVLVSRYEPAPASIRMLVPASLDEERLPPEGDTIEVASEASLPQDTLRKQAGGHEIAIGRGRPRAPKIKAIGEILSGWSSFFETTLRSLGHQELNVPVASQVGSFIVTISDARGGSSEPVLVHIKNALSDAFSRSKPTKALRASKLDLGALSKLLAAVVDNDEDVEISLVVAEGRLESMVHLRPNACAELLKVLSDELSSGAVPSDEVPQADRLGTVLRLVELVVGGQPVSPERLEIVPRQVNYYKQAARILGFLDAKNLPTFSGRRMAAAKTSNEKIRLASEAFSNSQCGWAWITWSAVDSVLALDEASASRFLTERATGISETTVGRRARTLRAWVTAFKGALG